MYIRNLMEDTGSVSEPGRRMICEHGLSFYLETPRHKLLFDLGATDAFLANARQAGIDVSQVDTAVISHGHYDHGGGLEAFLEANHRASVYLREGAFDPHISLQGENIHRIGLEPKLQENPRIHLLREDTWLDEELFVFGNVTERRLWSQSNRRLRMGTLGYPQDSFVHEQSLLLLAEGRRILLAGCSHCGIVNILEKCRELTGSWPEAVIGGLHLSNPRGQEELDLPLLEGTARYLEATGAVYYTGHCTGLEAYEWLRKRLGERIVYIHSGDQVRI